jgi:hypothetical protein
MNEVANKTIVRLIVYPSLPTTLAAMSTGCRTGLLLIQHV